MTRFPKGSGSQRFLTVYSGVLTAVFAVTVLSGSVDAPKKLSVEQLDVQRINLREPDGTLRLIVSSTDKAPGIYIKNKEYPHPSRKTAGMIFLNDEGTENGGLIFGGEKSADGYQAELWPSVLRRVRAGPDPDSRCQPGRRSAQQPLHSDRPAALPHP